MTIKTLKANSSSSSSSSSSSATSSSSCGANLKSNAISDIMPSKRGGAVKNLFNTSVDREELQQQIKLVERESYRALGNYKCEKKISEIRRDDADQMRRLKYLPAREIVVDKRQAKCTSQKTLQSMMLSRDEQQSTSSATLLKQQSSSSSSAAAAATASSKSSVASCKSTSSTSSSVLPRGQRTINDYYVSVKRCRQNR